MTAQSIVRLTVVIPAFNEQARLPGTLRSCLEYLEQQSYRSEIVVADDGSTDATREIVLDWQSGRVPLRLAEHPDRANHGKGAAVRIGMAGAQGAYRLFMDADNSTSLDQVGRFWPYFQEGCDIAVGSRNVPGAQVAVHQAFYKEMAGRVGNWIIRALAVPGIRDTQAGFKMFTQQSAESVFPAMTVERWGFDFEILAIARHRGYRICEVPITWINAPGSKVSLASYFQVLSEVRRVRRNLKSGKYDQQPIDD